MYKGPQRIHVGRLCLRWTSRRFGPAITESKILYMQQDGTENLNLWDMYKATTEKALAKYPTQLEAAKAMGVSERTVITWRRRWNIPLPEKGKKTA